MTTTHTLNQVERACAQLRRDGRAVTFTAVADLTGLGRSTLYRDPTIRAVIDQHRRQRHHRRPHRRDRHPPRSRRRPCRQSPPTRRTTPPTQATQQPKPLTGQPTTNAPISRIMLGQRGRRVVLRLVEGRVHRPAVLADPDDGSPRRRRLHRLVQRHPTPLNSRLPNSQRVRRNQRNPRSRRPPCSSLTKPPNLSVKSG
jgi:Family of unknown function (DUF6262)